MYRYREISVRLEILQGTVVSQEMSMVAYCYTERSVTAIVQEAVWQAYQNFPDMATNQNHVPRVHVPMLSDPEGLDRILDPEGVER